MTPERWQKVKAICHLALDREPGRRAAFLAEACTGDEELRREAESLLGRMTTEGVPDVPILARLGVADARRIPATVGRYRILRVLGEGGMGVVYEAEQDQPRRVVALKVIKPGLAGPEMLRRFERESEALARLHHAGIAQVYEAGAADSGFGPQPYFAMEFIHGAPLREYAQAHQRNTRQRLELMAKICDAVEHAHQRGIIHRDLKPGNILVEESGQPKILDFGVARVTDSDAQATRQTDVGQLIGTLAYMSPEQVLADPLELDTRSDVYALGVILYELLAGKLPYQLSKRLPEAVRTIREEDPSRLSSISRAYRGDVETIVAKALEKDKGRRYASAAALATDIRRHLADEPIAARPASTTYQLQKFARRHKALVGATGAVFVVLVAGVIVSTREAVLARRAQQTAQAVNDFLQNDLLAQASANTQASPNTRPDPDLKVRTALDRAAAKIGGKFEAQPEVEAAIRGTIGETYIDLGLYPQARTQLERALVLERRAAGAKDPKTLEMAYTLAHVAAIQSNYPEAESLLNETVALQRRILGVENRDTLASMGGLANIYLDQGKYVQAETLLNEILKIQRRVKGVDAPDTLSTSMNLANLYEHEGKYAAAEGLFGQIVETERRVLGPEHPGTLRAMANLANVYRDEDRLPQAEKLLGQVIEIEQRVLGPEHSDTLSSMGNLAIIEFSESQYAQAEKQFSQILEIQRRVLGPEEAQTLQTGSLLASVYLLQGKYAEAEALSRETLALQRKVLGPENPLTVYSLRVLANVYGLQGKYALAEEQFRALLEILRRTDASGTRSTPDALSDFGSMYQRWGKDKLAATYGEQALAGRRRTLGSEHSDTMSAAVDLALAYVSESKFGEAEPLAREALAFNQKKQPGDWQRFRAESLLGASLAGQKKYAEAEPLLVEGYEGMTARKERISVPDLYHVNLARDWIVQFYRAWGKPEKAAEWRKK